jgi:hypothetical protein
MPFMPPGMGPQGRGPFMPPGMGPPGMGGPMSGPGMPFMPPGFMPGMQPHMPMGGMIARTSFLLAHGRFALLPTR